MIRHAMFLAAVVAAAQADEQQDTKSFVYKKAKQADLELVVHYPPGWKETDKRPGIVFFFGGGWTGGKIEQFEPQAKHLASRGFVAARADYRVKTRHGVTPKECVEDAKSAVRWMRANAEDRIEVEARDDAIFLTVTSPSGIGSATVTLENGRWPGKLVLRLRLKGLHVVSCPICANLILPG